ncbi:MAG: metallophosphoesterase [Bacilli bacterium]|nr:metallophosphoesterase [Bacilli bacterium]
MKHIKLFYPAFLLTSLLLSGCNTVPQNPTSNSGSNSSSSSSTSLPLIEDIYDTKTPYYDDKQRENVSGSVNIYAINDFHGDVIGSTGMGIVNIASYLKDKKETEDAIVISSGDMWQGSIESNYNRGELLTQISNEVGFDALTIGNHEFDWSQEKILYNDTLTSETGYNAPFLAANIYKYDINNKTVGHYGNLGAKYVIRDLKNGIRVGIIGGIGSEQITSITSSFVDDLTFVDPIPVVQQLSDELRINKGCNVIILSIHADQDDALANNNAITRKSPNSGFKYVDAVLCAHTHQNEKQTYNGIPFIQTGGYGKQVSKISLNLSEKGNCYVNSYENLTSLGNVTKDEKIVSLVEQYKKESDLAGQEQLATISNYYNYNENIPNLVCAGIADYCLEKDIDVDYTMVNVGRKAIDASSSGETLTYGKLFESIPFDNEIYICEVSGQDFLRNCRSSYNSIYRFNGKAVYNNSTVKLAVIDYLALHRDADREYDNFPSMRIISKISDDGATLNYREITSMFLRSIPKSTIIDSSYFADNYSDVFNASNVSSNVTITPHPFVVKGSPS